MSTPDPEVRSLLILIATRNRWGLLKQCLDSLQAMDIPAWLQVTVRVVDNGSTDGSAAEAQRYLESYPLSAELLHEPVAGKSRALNRGLASIVSDVVAFTDDDMVMDRGWARAIAEHFAVCDCSGLQGAIALDFASGPRPAWFTANCGVLMGEAVVPPLAPLRGLPGGNMAVRTRVIREIGLFREDLGPHGKRFGSAEDVEWSGRLVAQGKRLCFCAGALNYHHLHADRLSRMVLFKRQFEFVRRETGEQPLAPSVLQGWQECRRLLGSLLVRRRIFEGFDFGLEIAQRLGRIVGMWDQWRRGPV